MGLRDLLFEDGNKKNNREDRTPPPVTAKPGAAAPAPAQVVGNIDPTIRATIEKSYTRPESPLARFSGGLKALDGIIPDQGMRVKAALATLTSQGTTPAVIIADIDRALGIVATKKREAEEASELEIKSSVETREQEVQRISSDIDAKGREIAQLQQDIAKLREAQGATSREIDSERTRINLIRATFDTTADAISRELTSQKATIQQYLPKE